MLAELGSIDGEILELHCQAPIHASLLHAPNSVHIKLLIRVDALVEAFDANSAVVTSCPDEPTCLKSITAQRRVRAHLECDFLLVTHITLTLIS